MTVSIVDTSVLVVLAQRDDFSVLARLTLPAIVPDIVDAEEILPAATKHPEHVQRYQLAKQNGLFRLEPLLGAAYGDYLRLRKRRTSPARNRGEDACIALALVYPGSVIYLDDDRGANRARDELGDPARGEDIIRPPAIDQAVVYPPPPGTATADHAYTFSCSVNFWVCSMTRWNAGRWASRPWYATNVGLGSRAQALRTRGDTYRAYQSRVSRFIPMPPKR